MRESIGGAWLFGIVITFIFMFSAFLAYSVSYAKAFNVKNEVINIIEQNMGINDPDKDYNDVNENEVDTNKAHWKIYRTIKNAGYNSDTAKDIPCKETVDDIDVYKSNYGINKTGTLDDSGVCIIKYCSVGDPRDEGDAQKYRRSTNVYYKVTTYIAIEIPVIQATFKIPITGETSSISAEPGNDPTFGTYYPCGDEGIN